MSYRGRSFKKKWDLLAFHRKFTLLFNTLNNIEIFLCREINLCFQIISGRLSWTIMSSIRLEQQIKFLREKRALLSEPVSPFSLSERLFQKSDADAFAYQEICVI
jgi:hypothetical protein